MDRGVWWATVHEVTDLETADATEHTGVHCLFTVVLSL